MNVGVMWRKTNKKTPAGQQQQDDGCFSHSLGGLRWVVSSFIYVLFIPKRFNPKPKATSIVVLRLRVSVSSSQNNEVLNSLQTTLSFNSVFQSQLWSPKSHFNVVLPLDDFVLSSQNTEILNCLQTTLSFSLIIHSVPVPLKVTKSHLNSCCAS